MDEQQLLVDGNVTVTTARLVNGQQTYALRNITSVKLDVKKPHPASPIVYGALAALAMIVALASSSWFLAGFGAIAAVVGWGSTRVTPIGKVVLVSSGNEQVALTTDHDRAQRVFDAVNRAIASH